MEVMRKRRGRFMVAMILFEDDQWDILQKVMAGNIITRAECKYPEGIIEYHAFNAAFDIVEDGERTPLYQVTITENGTVYNRL